MTVEEQKAFLTGTRLYLAREIRRTRWKEGVFSLRHMPTGSYLRVSADGLYILGCFGRGMTVAEVTTELVRTRRCPALRTLYAFIVEARARNILVEDPEATFPKVRVPRRWPTLAPTGAKWILGISLALGVAGIANQPYPLPALGRMTGFALGDVVVALVLLSVTASVGSLLASLTVLRLGGEVRYPKFLWRSWLPRLSFDWSDSEIGGPAAIESACLLRIAPFAWLSALCALVPSLHAIALIANIGLLLRCGPVSDPVRRWLHAHWRNPLKRTVARRWFFRNRAARVGDRIADLWEHDSRYAWRLLLFCCVWGAAAFALAGQASVGEVFAIFKVLGSLGSLPALAVTVGGLAALTLTVWFIAGRRRTAESASAEPRRRLPAGPAPVARALFDISPLFHALPPEVSDDLAHGCRLAGVPSGAGVVGIGQSGEELYVVRMGEFEVISRSDVSGDAVVMRLRPGDVFGELSFFGELLRPCNVRAVGHSEVYIVTAPDIQQTLMRHLSLPHIEEIVLRRPFIRSCPMLAGCDRRTVEEVVRLARFETVDSGRVIGGSGRENRHFSFIFTGSFEARYDDRKKDRMRSGASFGEVSMLMGENDDEFVALENSRRLIVGKDEFQPLIGRDPELALRLEEAAARRIGRPVFPYKPAKS